MLRVAIDDWIAQELDRLRTGGALRELRLCQRGSGVTVHLDGRDMINCSSNDYLGLASDKELLAAFYGALTPGTLLSYYGIGAGSSRLLTGNHFAYEALEQELACKYQRETALVFNSGYHANLGILSALADRRDVIFWDRLNHASLIDGARLSGATLIRYDHMDCEQLDHLLCKHRSHYHKAFIVSESVFSMDGDVADLRRLAELRDRHDGFLYVDEAHAVGVFGEEGLGCAEAQSTIGRTDLLLGTFGKAWGSLGAFCVCDRLVRDYLVNRMRPLIYTTALPPVIVNWNRFVLGRLADLREQREGVLRLAGRFRTCLKEAGLQTGGQSQIVPIVLGENEVAIRAAEALMDQGILLLPIRPPSVPSGTARLRVSLTAGLGWDDICGIPEIVRETVGISERKL
jgi:8-amino-7-oxononanoate synthase